MTTDHSQPEPNLLKFSADQMVTSSLRSLSAPLGWDEHCISALGGSRSCRSSGVEKQIAMQCLLYWCFTDALLMLLSVDMCWLGVSCVSCGSHEAPNLWLQFLGAVHTPRPSATISSARRRRRQRQSGHGLWRPYLAAWHMAYASHRPLRAMEIGWNWML